MKIIIIGGVAGGAAAAARLRRLSESAEIIMLERGGFISFANCGLPYYIGGDIKEKEAFLNHVVVVSEEDITTDKVGLGIEATVKNLDRDRIQVFHLVSSNEVDPTGEVKYISEDSPVGKALVGHKVGDICEAELPGGRTAKYEILELKRSN